MQVRTGSEVMESPLGILGIMLVVKIPLGLYSSQ